MKYVMYMLIIYFLFVQILNRKGYIVLLYNSECIHNGFLDSFLLYKMLNDQRRVI